MLPIGLLPIGLPSPQFFPLTLAPRFGSFPPLWLVPGSQGDSRRHHRPGYFGESIKKVLNFMRFEKKWGLPVGKGEKVFWERVLFVSTFSKLLR